MQSKQNSTISYHQKTPHSVFEMPLTNKFLNSILVLPNIIYSLFCFLIFPLNASFSFSMNLIICYSLNTIIFSFSPFRSISTLVAGLVTSYLLICFLQNTHVLQPCPVCYCCLGVSTREVMGLLERMLPSQAPVMGIGRLGK